MTCDPRPEAVPSKSKLFAPTIDAYGTRLALVFGNESKTGACPFYNHNCFHCDIGAGEGPFTPALNLQRLQYYRDLYDDVLKRLDHLVLYNSGSVLNPREMSMETLNNLLEFARGLNCSVISMDSRELFVHEPVIDHLRSGISAGQHLRITLGLETQDDHARRSVLNKQITRQNMARALAVLSKYNRQVGAELNVVFQPPGISPADSVAEAVKTIQYGLDLAGEYDVPVDFNFHPYYPSIIGSKYFPDHPRSLLPDAMAAITRGRGLIDEAGSGANLFIGWNDEGHDQNEPQRAAETRSYLARFLEFNRTQNPECLTK